jgi:hypothetical protein
MLLVFLSSVYAAASLVQGLPVDPYCQDDSLGLTTQCSRLVLGSAGFLTAGHSPVGANTAFLTEYLDDTGSSAPKARSWHGGVIAQSLIPEVANAIRPEFRDLSLGDDMSEEDPTVDPPPLHIQQLFVSGPSSNRVDLVFFSDGCTCCTAV